MSKAVTIDGLEELKQQLNGLKWVSTYMGPARTRAGRVVKSAIKSEAPTGPSGNLKRSITINPKRLSKRPRGMVFVAVDYGIAPHAHLVEFGARGGDMPANPFFSRGFEKSKTAAEAELAAGVQAALDKAIK